MQDSASITTAGTLDVAANYKRLSNMLSGPYPGDAQFARVAVTADAAMTGVTKTLRFVLLDEINNVVRAVVIATITGTTTRSGPAGTTGGYLCTVEFPNGSALLDLTGADHKNKLNWWVGSPDAFHAGVTGYTVNLFGNPQA